MAIADSLARLASTLVSIVQTRLELATVELEEELQRLLSYLMMAVAALFCLGVSLLLGIFLIVVLYWDTHRIAAMLSLIALFGVTSLLLAWGLRRNFQKKPKFLTHTLNEFKRDREKLHATPPPK